MLDNGGESSSDEEENWQDVSAWVEDEEVEKTQEPVSGWCPELKFEVEDPGPRGFEPDASLLTIFLALLGEIVPLSVTYTNLYAKQQSRSVAGGT